MSEAQIGLIGLAVMGETLALNIEEKGFSVALYKRSRGDAPVARSEARGRESELAQLVDRVAADLLEDHQVANAEVLDRLVQSLRVGAEARHLRQRLA